MGWIRLGGLGNGAAAGSSDCIIANAQCQWRASLGYSFASVRAITIHSILLQAQLSLICCLSRDFGG